MPESPRPLRIVYAAGPGDVVGTYRHWREGRDDPSQVAVTYSGQFYDLCRALGARAYVISNCPRREKLVDGPFTLEHRPLRFVRGPGPLYHLAQVWAGLRLTATAVRFRADVVLTMGGAAWFSLFLLPLLGVKVVLTLHGHFWRVARPPRGLDALLWRLNARFLRRGVAAVMYISDSVAGQVRSLVGPAFAAPMLHFVPTYRRRRRSASSTPAAWSAARACSTCSTSPPASPPKAAPASSSTSVATAARWKNCGRARRKPASATASAATGTSRSR